MTILNVVATFQIKPEFESEFNSEFKKLVEKTRSEEGCIQYDLNKDVKNPNTYIFVEQWKSQDAINQHDVSDHFKHFIAFCEGKTESIAVHVLKKVL